MQNAECRMHNAQCTMHNGECGSVLMEYVVLCCFIGCVILLFLHNEFYNVIDGYHTRGPLKLGEGYVYFQKLRLFALSLPIP